jgi:hypothetical protein
MKMNDQVTTLHGTGKIVAVENQKGVIKYGVLHDKLNFKLPKGYHAEDIIYYTEKDLSHD